MEMTGESAEAGHATGLRIIDGVTSADRARISDTRRIFSISPWKLRVV